MGKRQKIAYNGEELANNLKQSTGKGVDAFSPDTSPTSAQPDMQQVELPSSQEADENVYAHVHARTHADISAPEHEHSSIDAETRADMAQRLQDGAATNTLTPARKTRDAGVDAPTDANVVASKQARMHAPTNEARNDDSTSAADDVAEVDIDVIQKAIRIKRHLSSFTFRFRANELEDLDLVIDELNQDDEHRISKNDAVRTALNWLLADYRLRKEQSVLARVLMDT